MFVFLISRGSATRPTRLEPARALGACGGPRKPCLLPPVDTKERDTHSTNLVVVLLLRVVRVRLESGLLRELAEPGPDGGLALVVLPPPLLRPRDVEGARLVEQGRPHLGFLELKQEEARQLVDVQPRLDSGLAVCNHRRVHLYLYLRLRLLLLWCRGAQRMRRLRIHGGPVPVLQYDVDHLACARAGNVWRRHALKHGGSERAKEEEGERRERGGREEGRERERNTQTQTHRQRERGGGGANRPGLRTFVLVVHADVGPSLRTLPLLQVTGTTAHAVSTRSAHGQHTVGTWSARGRRKATRTCAATRKARRGTRVSGNARNAGPVGQGVEEGG